MGRFTTLKVTEPLQQQMKLISSLDTDDGQELYVNEHAIDVMNLVVPSG